MTAIQTMAEGCTLRGIVKDGEVTFTGAAAQKVARICGLYLEEKWGGEKFTSFPLEKDWRYYPVLVAAGFRLAILNY